MKIEKIKLFSFLLLGFGLIFITYIFCQKIFFPSKEKLYTETQFKKVDIEINDVHYIETNKYSQKEWEIWAKKANYNREKSLSQFFNVKLVFFSGDKPSFTLTGDRGILNTKTRNIELIGNIKSNMRDGFSFTTNSLIYNSENKEIFTPDKVTLNKGAMVIKGKTMSYDLTRKKLKLKKKINAKTSG
jgi:LPS export ABC transporter protein LptC